MVDRHKQRRAVITDGLRTPFVKSNTVFKNLSALDLAKRAVSELLQRVPIPHSMIDAVIFGQVIPSLEAPNIAREIVVGTRLNPETDAYTVSKACITGYQAVMDAVMLIESGAADCVLAGGADSASQVPMAISEHLRDTLMSFSQGDPWREGLKSLTDLSMADLKPQTPALREPSTGLTMGESAEKMAKLNGIPREEQDDFAHRSHQLASQAWEDGKFKDEVMTIYPPPDFKEFVKCDQTVRFDSDRTAYKKLKPSFDKDHGSITAGNSSPLSDGASVVMVMEESKARELGIDPLGHIVSSAFSAVDPFRQLLIGPVFSAPAALEKAGLDWDQMDLIDMHEAFAAQILSVVKCLTDKEYAADVFDFKNVPGALDMEKFNVNGGSIALGHPFAATGGRQIIQTLRELKRRGAKRAICSACAAGGLSAAMVLETV